MVRASCRAHDNRILAEIGIRSLASIDTNCGRNSQSFCLRRMGSTAGVQDRKFHPIGHAPAYGLIPVSTGLAETPKRNVEIPKFQGAIGDE